MDADLTAGHRVRGKEPQREQAQAQHDRRQPGTGTERHTEQHQPDATAQHVTRAEARHQPSGPAGAEDAGQIDDEQQADDRRGQPERRACQAEANVVEQRDETAHQQEGLEKQPAQPGVAQMQTEVAEQHPKRERLRLEVARSRQQPDEQAQREQAEPGDAAQGELPAADVTEQPRQQATEQPTQCRSTDIEPHRRRQRRRVEFLAHIGHRQRRQTAQRQPQQGPQRQQQVPRLHHHAGQAQQAGQAERGGHHRLASPALGQRSGYQQTERQAQGGQRQRETAGRRRHGEMRRQQRQQRLHAIEHRKGGEAGAEQRQRGPAISRSALPQVGVKGVGRHVSRRRESGKKPRSLAHKEAIYATKEACNARHWPMAGRGLSFDIRLPAPTHAKAVRASGPFQRPACRSTTEPNGADRVPY